MTDTRYLKIDAKGFPSPFAGLQGIEYFDFEEEFMANGIRCIPMAIRMKMDMAGIKLKLGEWNRFTVEDRITLALKPCGEGPEIESFRQFLASLIQDRAGKLPKYIEVDAEPEWQNRSFVPMAVFLKGISFGVLIGLKEWGNLTALQRFALIKLCRAGHQNHNFPAALKEFGLLT